jgi:hypothetical protein
LACALAVGAIGIFALFILTSGAPASVTIVNPSDQVVYVTINEHAMFEVPANGEVSTPMSTVDRYGPLLITARDARGATIFAVTTSLPRIEAQGNRVELRSTGQTYDPLQQFAGQVPSAP